MLNPGLKFTKMSALGNDFVCVDAINQRVDRPHALAVAMSNRHFGIGSDGLLLICPSSRADVRMRIFNPDGTEAEMCGNAVRSVGKFAYHYGLVASPVVTVETIGGVKTIHLEIKNGDVTNITADIGAPIFDAPLIPVITDGPDFIDRPMTVADRTFAATAISAGNPFVVSFVDDVYGFDLDRYGPQTERHPIFPNKVNAVFTQVLSPDRLRMRVWERGTGETIACGIGCCLSTAAGVLTGRNGHACAVEQVGGVTYVEWNTADGRLFMTGPSDIVYEGVWKGRSDETIPVDPRIGLYSVTGRP